MIGKYARFKHPGLVENFDHPIRMVDKRVWGKLMLNFFVGSAPMLKYSDWLMIFCIFCCISSINCKMFSELDIVQMFCNLMPTEISMSSNMNDYLGTYSYQFLTLFSSLVLALSYYSLKALLP